MNNTQSIGSDPTIVDARFSGGHLTVATRDLSIGDQRLVYLDGPGWEADLTPREALALAEALTAHAGTSAVVAGAHRGCTVYAWCTVDHSEDSDDFERSYHKRSVEASGIEADFITDNDEGSRIYWDPGCYWTFTSDNLDDLSSISAAFLAIRREFGRFLAEVTQ